ncbi:MAG: hypothetical protein QNJ22_16065 [Desulfosarcinaceae bacterium]|nr:hypothetical protein [Desulfosarcinaceae bacterium]
MNEWVEPTSLTESVKRALVLRNCTLLLVVVALVALEMRFDWAERLLGAYLVTTNNHRPESGAIWEVGHQTSAAREALEALVNERQSLQSQAEEAVSLAEIFGQLAQRDSLMLSADQFLRLYRALPDALRREVASPYHLLTLVHQGRWERTFFQKQGATIALHLLDGHNTVLSTLTISDTVQEYIDRGEVAVAGRLTSLSDFARQIYPANRFFQVLESLPEAVQRGILPQPESLLASPDRILRVGISSEAYDGTLTLGFEREGSDGPRVILVQGREWDVWQLARRLNDSGGITAPEMRFDQGGGGGQQ